VQHLALVFGQVGDGEDVPTRLHRENVLGDVFGADRLLHKVIGRLGREGRGVLVYLREGATGVPAQVLRPRDARPSNSELARDRQWREIGLGAQILRDLGVASIRLLTTRVGRYVGLAGFGVAIAGSEIVEG
jgi:3,4-dihydroxy 2-butanone 4-phosphate synthase/GTP cyclohydrolase II